MTADLADPIDVLARTIWGEDRGGGDIGMHAVANVICNRANHPRWWGTDIVAVCMEPSQFSCWNHGDPNRDKVLGVTDADPQFRAAIEIARRAVEEDLLDVTEGADSYYAIGSPTPSWVSTATFTVEIAGQRFYRAELAEPLESEESKGE